MLCKDCGTTIPENSLTCPNCGAPISNTQLQEIEELPMNWYNFLIRFGLWIAGIVILIIGIGQLLGLPYVLRDMDPMLIYAQYPLLMFLDLIYGVCCLGLGVLFIIARFRMAAFKAKSPALLYYGYALCIITPLLYSFVSGRILGTPAKELFGIYEILQLLGTAAGVALNVIYFNKREHLFYN